MAQVVYSRQAFADLDRIVVFLTERGVDAMQAALDVIADAVEVLERHPLIGRSGEHELRELVISHGKTGYVALYDFRPAEDLVTILAIRSQREAGYR